MNARIESRGITTELLLEVFDIPVSFHRWTQETGLSRWEQETARRALRRAGLLEERRLGMPAKLWFRVCADVLMHALQASVDRGGR